MPKLKIDNQDVTVPEGASILQGARQLGIDVPALCYLEGMEATTSCMVCMVEVVGQTDLVPACSTLATDGMEVVTQSDAVMDIRKAALELLMSEHLGDCMGPCQVACPAHMDIPRMIRLIAAGNMREAVKIVKRDIALPAVLGHICPAPCEKVCRRAQVDAPVGICLLKRIVGECDIQGDSLFVPQPAPAKDKQVAIVGGGPAGLSAAYYLQLGGYACTIFDEHEQLGGLLRYGVPDEDLPKAVLDAEIQRILALGVTVECQTRIGPERDLESLCHQFDAVFVAVGTLPEDHRADLGLAVGKQGFSFDRQTYQSSLEGVFVGGDCIRARKVAIRSLADGKEAAASMAQYLDGQPVTGPQAAFNTRIGKMTEPELQLMLNQVNQAGPVKVANRSQGYTQDQAQQEAGRCLHCDCRKADDCKLRQYSEIYEIKPNRYPAKRAVFTQLTQHPEVVYESGKCIRCGICTKITEQAQEGQGLTFIGRGYDTQVGPPLDKTMAEALTKTATDCIENCPTGALAFRKLDEKA